MSDSIMKCVYAAIYIAIMMPILVIIMASMTVGYIWSAIETGFIFGNSKALDFEAFLKREAGVMK